MLQREATIERLQTILSTIRENLADPDNDRQTTLENTERDLSGIVDLLTDTSDVTLPDLVLLLDLTVPAQRESRGGCPDCGNCIDPNCRVRAILPDHHAMCHCPPKTAESMPPAYCRECGKELTYNESQRQYGAGLRGSLHCSQSATGYHIPRR